MHAAAGVSSIRSPGDPGRIRNFCLVAHVDHGKTTITDFLVALSGGLASSAAGRVRYMDWIEDEQARQITMKMAAMHIDFEDHVLTLIDSPGHVDFSCEVSAALALSDGALLVVDVKEGITPQAAVIMQHAYSQGIPLCLILNKIDRLFCEMALSPEDAYVHVLRVLAATNAIMAGLATAEAVRDGVSNQRAPTTPLEDEGGATRATDLSNVDTYFDPVRGNVLFAAAADGWAFRLSHMAELYSAKFGVVAEKFVEALWGEWYFNPKTKAVTSKPLKEGQPVLAVQCVFSLLAKAYSAVSAVTAAVNDAAALTEDYRLPVPLPRRPTDPQPLEPTLRTPVATAAPSFPRPQGGSSPPSGPGPSLPAQSHSPTTVAAPTFPTDPTEVAAVEAALALSALAVRMGVSLKDRALAGASRDPHLLARCVLGGWCPLGKELARMVISRLPSPVVGAVARWGTPCRTLEIEGSSSSGAPNAVIDASDAQAVTQSAPLVAFVAKLVEPESLPGTTSSAPLSGQAGLSVGAAFPDGSEETTQQCMARLSAKAERLVAIVRVLSGSLHAHQTVFVHDAERRAARPIQIGGVGHFTPYGLQPTSVVSAGMLCAVDGLGAAAVSGDVGTTFRWGLLSSSAARVPVPPMAMTAPAAAVFRFALQPARPSDLPRLIAALRLLAAVDPQVIVLHEGGEILLCTAGELHAERCLADLRKRFTGIDILTSPPMVSYRETVVWATARLGAASERTYRALRKGQKDEAESEGSASGHDDWSESDTLSSVAGRTMSSTGGATSSITARGVRTITRSEEDAVAATSLPQLKPHAVCRRRRVCPAVAATPGRHCIVRAYAVPLPPTVTDAIERAHPTLSSSGAFVADVGAAVRAQCSAAYAAAVLKKAESAAAASAEASPLVDPAPPSQAQSAAQPAAADAGAGSGDRAARSASELASAFVDAGTSWASLGRSAVAFGPKRCGSCVLFVTAPCSPFAPSDDQGPSSGPSPSRAGAVRSTPPPSPHVDRMPRDAAVEQPSEPSCGGESAAGPAGTPTTAAPAIPSAAPSFAAVVTAPRDAVTETLFAHTLDAVERAFQLVSGSGPLAAEPMRGVAFIVEMVAVSNTAAYAADFQSAWSLMGNVVGAAQSAFRSAVGGGEERSTAPHLDRRIAEPMLHCSLSCDEAGFGAVHSTIARRRGEVVATEMQEGTDVFTIESLIPAADSVGLTSELRQASSGGAISPHPLRFAGYRVLAKGPFWKPTTASELEEFGDEATQSVRLRAREIVMEIRKRKGMLVPSRIIDRAEAQKFSQRGR